MRLTRLVVTAFRGVKRAELDFGPALNVVGGPNDLGKSTLGTAVYAALLVPVKTEEFQSWHCDVETPPTVALTFEEDGRFWRIEKRFGVHGHATLESSKDGHAWKKEATARAVDDELRKLLQWGVRPPGGPSAQRGLPTSFLSNALLAPQSDVDEILSSGLENDTDESGKLRLTSALSALAQDPVFKRLLDTAQEETERFYTATGKKKSGAASPFKGVNEEIKSLGNERLELEDSLNRGAAIEQQVNTLREQRAQTALAVEDANGALEQARADLEKGRARALVAERLEVARRDLAQVEALRARLTAAHESLAARTTESGHTEQRLARAQATTARAQHDLESATEAVRTAKSAGGAEARATKRAQLGEQVAMLRATIERLETQRTRLAEAIARATALAAARSDLQKADARLPDASTAVDLARRQLAQKQTEETLAADMLAFARWTDAKTKQQAAATTRDEAYSLRASAFSKEAEALQLEARLSAEAARRRTLPTDAERRQFSHLEKDLAVAKAQLGGAFRVSIRPHSALTLSATVDEKPAVDEKKLMAERSYEAERRVLLAIGNLVDIEVTGGTAERRAELEALQRRWTAEVAPVLQALGLSSLAALDTVYAAEGERDAAGRKLRDDAATLRQQKQAALQRADLLEQQATGAPTNEVVASREAALGPTDRVSLQGILTSLGAAWEEQVARLITGARTGVSAATSALSDAEKRLNETTWKRDELARLVVSLEGDATSVEGDSYDLERGLATANVQHDLAARELASLGEQESAVLASATTAHERARSALELAAAAQHRDEQAVAAARTALGAAQGEVNALGAQVGAVDLAGLTSRLEAAQREFAHVQGLPTATADDVRRAEELLEQRRGTLEALSREFHVADGRLTSIGGPGARDRMREVEQALLKARQREQHLTIDANAWKLLHETLREVENQQGAHLGRALADGVSRSFATLTAGRYSGLSMATDLTTKGVLRAGTAVPEDEVLRGLSHGTRNQLATLIRLAIASELRTAIVLDDQLVHTDPKRVDWFTAALRKTAVNAQVIILTCRPDDYLAPNERVAGATTRDSAGVRAIDAEQLISAWT